MRTNCLIRIVFLLLLTTSSQVSAQTNRAANLKQRLQSTLDSLQKANGFPGVTFTAILAGGQEISIAAGLADSSGMKPMKPANRMLAGSTGKTFFAAAVLSLVDARVLRLDDPISKHLGSEPWFGRLPNAQHITIRMLMNHTSGIEEYYELGDFMQRLKSDPYRQWKPLELLSYVLDRQPLFEAGKGWGYSDTNYLVLGYLVEKVTGKRMYDLADKYAIRPNGLHKTEPSTKDRYKDLATGYSRPGSPFPFYGAVVNDGRMVFSPQFEWTGGGFLSSSSDLARWAKSLYYLDSVKPELRKEMQTGVRAQTGKDHLYGLGLQIRPVDNGYTYGHSGWFPGYLTDCLYVPESDLALAIQFNTDNVRQLKRSTMGYLQLLGRIITESQSVN